MADNANITRRAAIVGLATAGATAVSAAVAAAEPVQNVGIAPKSVPSDIATWLETAPARDVADWHLAELVKAMSRQAPGRYVACFTRTGGATVTYDSTQPNEAWIGWEI